MLASPPDDSCRANVWNDRRPELDLGQQAKDRLPIGVDAHLKPARPVPLTDVHGRLPFTGTKRVGAAGCPPRPMLSRYARTTQAQALGLAVALGSL